MNKFKIVLTMIVTSLLLQSCGSWLVATTITDHVRRDWSEKDFGVIDDKLRNKDIYLGEMKSKNVLNDKWKSIPISCSVVPNNLESKCFIPLKQVTGRKTKHHKAITSNGLLFEIIQNDKKTYYSINYKVTVTDTDTNQIIDEWLTPYMEPGKDIRLYLEEYFELLNNEIK